MRTTWHWGILSRERRPSRGFLVARQRGQRHLGDASRPRGQLQHGVRSRSRSLLPLARQRYQAIANDRLQRSAGHVAKPGQASDASYSARPFICMPHGGVKPGTHVPAPGYLGPPVLFRPLATSLQSVASIGRQLLGTAGSVRQCYFSDFRSRSVEQQEPSFPRHDIFRLKHLGLGIR